LIGFEFTESIEIGAPANRVWSVMTELEDWWVDSNPEHESLERLDDRGVAVGARLRIREKVAGVPGEYVGELTRVVPMSEVTMEAPSARYRLLGIPFTVGEGVTWRLEPLGEHAAQVSARVWATFPHGLMGRLVAWTFVHVLNGVAKDREHARTELRYLKRLLEAGAE
jgi:hypothetical protein